MVPFFHAWYTIYIYLLCIVMTELTVPAGYPLLTLLAKPEASHPLSGYETSSIWLAPSVSSSSEPQYPSNITLFGLHKGFYCFINLASHRRPAFDPPLVFSTGPKRGLNLVPLLLHVAGKLLSWNSWHSPSLFSYVFQKLQKVLQNSELSLPSLSSPAFQSHFNGT